MPDIDAMIYTAESAAAWTLVYPEWTVVVPKDLEEKTPMAVRPLQGSSSRSRRAASTRWRRPVAGT